MVGRRSARQVRFPILCALWVAWALAGPAGAQGVGNITGVVTDEEGIPLAGAFVVVDGTSVAAITDRDGGYSVTGIPAGRQVLVVSYVSYRTERREVNVVAGDTITEHVTLFVDLLDLERVVVTGASNPKVKLESSVAITTLNREEIEADAPLSTTALLTSIPGFWAESSGGQSGGNLFARGLPQDGSFRYVAMYEDGLPVYESPTLSFANVDTFYRLDETVDVMEAVRGGSASIFASNAPGGLINFISKTGGEAAEGTLRLTLGNYGLFRGDFNYGGPVGEDWRYNVGGFYRFDSGIRDPDFPADQGGQVRLNLTRMFDGGFVRFYFKALDEKNIFYLPIPLQDADNPKSIPGVNAQFGTMTSLDAATVRVPTGDGEVRSMDLRDGVNPRVLSFGIEFYRDLGNGWSVENNARYTDIDLNYNAVFSGADPASAGDYAVDALQEYNDSGIGPAATTAQYSYVSDGTPVVDPATMNGNGLVLEYGWWNVQKPMSSFTNDLRTTRGFDRHDLTLGIYFSSYRADDFWQFNDMLIEARNAPRMLNLEFLDAGGTVVGAATQNGFTHYGSRYVRASNSAQVVALYANDEWEISKRWRLDAGLRYEYAGYDGNTEVTAQYDISDSNPLSETPSGQPSSVPTLADRDLQWGTGRFLPYSWSFGNWAGSVGANYGLSERLAVFGRLSSGFRQPTFDRWSVLAPGSTQITEGESETVRQVEAGVKIATGKLGLFASAFYSRLDNVIFNDEVLDSEGDLVPRNGEASTETPGAEVELVFRPGPLWLLEGMLTLQQAKYRQFYQQTGDGAPLDFSGNRVRRIPDVVLTFRPTFQLGRFKTFLDWTHVGERYSDDANTVTLPAYDTIDFGLIYTRQRTSYALHATNLFNAIGLTEGNPRSGQVVGTLSDVYLARPILGRTLRLSVSYRF